MALATFAQIKDFLELKKADITDYPTLGVLLPAMQKTFEKFCVREFDIKERTRTFRITDEDGESSFWLEGTPIISITSIVATDTSNVDTTLELNDDYYFDGQHVQLLAALPEGSIIVIVYEGGLIDQTDETSFLATIPADLNLACIRQVSFEFQNRSKLAATDISLDQNSVKIPELTLLKYSVLTLNGYKNIGTGF